LLQPIKGIVHFGELIEAAIATSAARCLADIAGVGRVVSFLVGGAASGMTGDKIMSMPTYVLLLYKYDFAARTGRASPDANG
jgi:enoyl-[acyl-carrier-protein] reductase (NADH)